MVFPSPPPRGAAGELLGLSVEVGVSGESMPSSGFPSDRHAYHLKCFMHPMRYCFSSSSSSFYKFFISVQTYIFYV